MTINADLTIFNLYIDSETKREVMIPTEITGVSWYDTRSQPNGGNRPGSASFVIRIPYTAEIQDGRTYVSETDYAELADSEKSGYWTIQKGSYVVKGTGIEATTFDQLREAEEDFVTVTEYADNTVRGTDRIKHWRIGGM